MLSLGSEAWSVREKVRRKISASFVQEAERQIAALDQFSSDDQIVDPCAAGQVIHQVEHEFFEDHSEAAGAEFAIESLNGDGVGSLVGEDKVDALEFEEFLILLEDGVARLGEDFDEGGLVQLVEDADDGQATDEFGNEAVADEILRFGEAKKLNVALGADCLAVLGLITFGNGLEAEGLFADAASDDALEADDVIRSALSGDMYRVFMHYKRDEWERYCAHVSDWDVAEYLDVLP